jgi:hypothetical protein
MMTIPSAPLARANPRRLRGQRRLCGCAKVDVVGEGFRLALIGGSMFRLLVEITVMSERSSDGALWLAACGACD